MASIADLAVQITADSSALDTGLAAAASQAEGFVQAATIATRRLQADVDRTTASLQKQAETFGMTASQAKLYELAQRGATEEQLTQAKAAEKALSDKQKAAAEGEKKGFFAAQKDAVLDLAKKSPLQLTAGVAAIGFAATAASQAKTLQEKIGGITQVAAMIPGPVGVAAAAIGGLLGTAVGMVLKDHDRLKARVSDAYESMTSGAKTARQAMDDIRIDTLTDGLNRAKKASGDFWASVEGLGARQGARMFGQLPRVELELTFREAAQAEERLRLLQTDPLLSFANRHIQTLRARRGTADLAEQTSQAGVQAALQGQLLATGSTARQAADAAQLLAVAQALARQNSSSLADAQARLAEQLRAVAQAQAAARAGGAAQQAGETVRAANEEIAVLQRRAEFARGGAGRGGEVAVDMSAEEEALARRDRDMARLEADQARARGAIDEASARGSAEAAAGNVPQAVQAGIDFVQAQARALELAQQRAALEAGIIAQAGALERQREARLAAELAQRGEALRVQQRTALEAFGERQAELQQLRAAGAIDEATHARALTEAAGGLERAAGEERLGPAAMVEGSAAASSAIARARLEQRREDRGAALARAVMELRNVAERQAAFQRETVAILRGGLFAAGELP